MEAVEDDAVAEDDLIQQFCNFFNGHLYVTQKLLVHQRAVFPILLYNYNNCVTGSSTAELKKICADYKLQLSRGFVTHCCAQQ